MSTFEEITADLPRLELVVAGHPAGYRAVANFGTRHLFVAIDDDFDTACALARAGLEALIASSRD